VNAPARRIAWLLPGSLDVLTGGTLYDRRIVAGLREAGWHVDVVTLSSRFPWPDADALEQANTAVTQLPDGQCVVADGLAFGAVPALAHAHAHRLRWVALVHHPLALEAGLTATQCGALRDSERQALAAARTVVVTSPATARALQADYGVAAERLHVVLPGTAAAPLAKGSGTKGTDEPLSLLCVATLTQRKGHLLLIEALAALQDRRWVLHCAGNTTRDPATTRAVQRAIAEHGLTPRVVLHGELDAAALHSRYLQADAFVLPSLHEGYGMALAEALSYGLPVISTTAGAIPETVPADAAALVPPGDGPALRDALARLCDDPAWRAQRAAGARAARAHLTDWADASAQFAAVLEATR
jgi:glycosyltransferase involved in cell wall biosynthesis